MADFRVQTVSGENRCTNSDRNAFVKAKFSMDGFILTTTSLDDIRGAKGKTWEELGRDYHVMEQTVSNVTPLLVMPAGK